MSVPMLNNSIAKQDFLNIQIPVQDEINEHSRAMMQYMRKMKSNMRHCEALPFYGIAAAACVPYSLCHCRAFRATP